MKLIKYVPIWALLAALVGCGGGHGYEGEYESKTGSSNKLLDAFAGVMGSQNVVIGSDYTESEGLRKEYDEIFVRESGEEKYLVFKNEESEQAWKILDEDTLLQNAGFVNIKLVRIK